MTITAWYMDTDEVTDQRLPHATDSPVNLEQLIGLGVLSWSGLTGAGIQIGVQCQLKIDLFLWHSFKIIHICLDDPRLAEIRHDRGYTYTDVVNVCPEKLPNFEEKIKSFYKEHIHYGKDCFCQYDFSAVVTDFFPSIHQTKKSATAWKAVATSMSVTRMISG